MAAGNETRGSWLRILAGAVISGVVVLAAFLAVDDARAFLEVAKDIRPLPVLVAMLATVGAYLAFCATLVSAARIGGSPLRFREAVATSFVSEAVNNLLSTGGIGGIAIRVYGFGKRGVPAGVSLGMSAVTTLMGDAVITLLVQVGLVYLFVAGRIEQRTATWLVAIGVLLLVVLGAVAVRLRDPAARKRVGRWFGRRAEGIASKLGRADLTHGEGLAKFRADFFGFFREIGRRPRGLVAPYACALVDYTLRIVCLGAAFAAVGHPLGPLVLLTAFGIGIAAGALSLVPGGIGVVEGSMSAAFVLMGVPLAVAGVAVIVFRFCYYVFPLIAVSVLFRRMLRPA